MDYRERKLMETVDCLADQIVDFAMRLVAEPSTLGNEAGATAIMEAELERLGFAVAKIPLAGSATTGHSGFAPVPWSIEDRFNVVGSRAPDRSGGRSALFNGHLDVVAAGTPERWTRDPYTPTITDGWLYGRGAGDMKAGVAAMTYAVHAVDQAGFGLAAPVTVEAVIEEECSGNGAVACLAAGYDAEAVLIPEPFGPTILTDQLGVLWFKVALSGRSTHVLQARSGVNAIEKCFPLIAALRGLEAELNEEARPPAYAGLVHPINLNVGIIEGGDWPSTVPAEAAFHGRLSFYPGVRCERISRRIEETVHQAAAEDEWLRNNPPTVTFYGFRSEGHSLPRDLPAFTLLDRCHQSLTGRSAESYISTCTTDLRAFHHFGTGQPTCYGPVAENIHGVDERVAIDSIIQVARTYTLFLARWCLLTE
ncbi:MAG: ArgE/DapE family deacylase [Desulfofustis sp.]|nr:ArgE/DapE family deacylase [Desulfofustis sp.]